MDRDTRNVARLESIADSAVDTSTDTEVAGLADMLIVGVGGLCSIAIATLGIWKLAELLI